MANFGPFDVVIYGGTIAGINAAYTAALSGCKVALLEPTAHLGGMLGAGGLVWHDVQTRDVGGTSWHIWKAIAAAEGYDPVTAGTATGTPILWPGPLGQIKVSSVSTNQGYMDISNIPGQITCQPKTAAAVLNQLASGSLVGLRPVPAGSLNVFKNAALVPQGAQGTVYPSVLFSGSGQSAAISGLVTTAGVFTGSVFIDASYEGDVMAGVAQVSGGAQYTWGREGGSNESPTLQGFQPDAGNNSFHGFNGNHFPAMVLSPVPVTGSGDQRVMACGFRASIQPIANGGVAFPKPTGYDSSAYQQLQAIAVSGPYTTLTQAVTLNQVAGGKYCMNDGPDIFTMAGQCYGYPDGTPAQRAAIIAAHKLWYQGLLYFCANDIVGVNTFKTNAATYGLSSDEFVDNGNWPYQMYVREGRRLIGVYQMKYSDCANSSTAATGHSVAKGSYVEDSHSHTLYVNPNDSTKYVVEGKVASNTSFGKSVQIPMESLIPVSCPNLIVPVCHSTTHLAWTCLRTEFLFGANGDAAGFMAARVAKYGDPNVQSINYTALTNMLTGIGCSF